MYPEIDAVEREQIAWVFGLTGGELEDKPLRALDLSFETPRRRWFRYHMPWAPDYAESDFRNWRGSVMTIVGDNLWGCEFPKRIQARGKRWRLARVFTSSGETECPGKECEEPIPEGGRCPLCEGSPEDGHGYIYLGDGWAEAVYLARD